MDSAGHVQPDIPPDAPPVEPSSKLGSPTPTELDMLSDAILIDSPDSPEYDEDCMCHMIQLPDRQPLSLDEWPLCDSCMRKIRVDETNTAEFNDIEGLAEDVIATFGSPAHGCAPENGDGAVECPSTHDQPLRRLRPLGSDPIAILDSPEPEPPVFVHDQAPPVEVDGEEDHPVEVSWSLTRMVVSLVHSDC